ncbi:MAG: chromosomal replication initiator protein DnaA [Ruminobacter sp.]|nr:chromosomal replication initiator protein DnaA [Ruminobacter sp.]
MIDIELIKEKISQYPLKASDNRILRIFLKSAKLIAVNNIIYILVANGLVASQLNSKINILNKVIYDAFPNSDYEIKIEISSNFSLGVKEEKINVKNDVQEKKELEYSNVNTEENNTDDNSSIEGMMSLLKARNTDSNENITSNISGYNSNSNFEDDKKTKAGTQNKVNSTSVANETYRKYDITKNHFYRSNTIQSDKNFDNFVESASNQQLCHSAKEVVCLPGRYEINPFFIYGETGLGKTHMLYAIGNGILKEHPDLTVMYIDINLMFAQYQEAVESYSSSKYDRNSKQNILSDFKSCYRNLDVLLIDDIQELHRFKGGFHDEFLQLLNDLSNSADKKTQLVFASSVYVDNINNLEARLKSRLQEGVEIKVQPPDLEARKRIVKLKMTEQSLNPEKKVIDFIAETFQTNIRIIEGHIKTIRIYAKSRKTKDITINIVKEALKSKLVARSVILTVDNIKEKVAEHYHFSVKDLESKSRVKPLVRARMMAMKLARDKTGESLPSIGKKFGGKDHTTVMNACKKIAELIEKEPSIADDYEVLNSLFS